jgi:hypothetical protein
MGHKQTRIEPEAAPLHLLPHLCCCSGACRATPTWPMDHPPDGWLQLEGRAESTTPVDLFSFSSSGVGVVISASYPSIQDAMAR